MKSLLNNPISLLALVIFSVAQIGSLSTPFIACASSQASVSAPVVSDRKETTNRSATEAHESLFFPSQARTSTGKLLDLDMFDRAEVCADCHQEIYEEWKDSVMGHSWDDPIYRALLERASIATNGFVDNFCIGCHSPIGLTTKSVRAIGEENGNHLTGIGCEDCHNISEATGTENASYVLTPEKISESFKFGPRNDAESPYHETAYSKLHTNSKFCGACHNATHPANRVPIERTYDEWKDSPYNAAGVTCQDCHMTPGPGVNKLAGKSAPSGKVRVPRYSHYFTGANTTLHKSKGQHEMAERALQMLKSAATIEFLNLPHEVQPGKHVTIQIKVKNIGAGHKLPTGFPEGREMWVDFRAIDSQGREIYRLGEIENGHTEDGTKSFKATLGDDKGNIVDLNVWEASVVLSDTRILPKGYAIVEYTFQIPEKLTGLVTLKADLNYWSFSQSLIDRLLGPGKMKVDVVNMASTSQNIGTM